METRRSARLPKDDYGKQGVYFVTLCTQDRACILWNDTDICYPVEANIVRLPADVPLSAIGHLVQAGINNIPLHYPNISVDIAAIMPNHVHLLLCVSSLFGRTLCAPTVETEAPGINVGANSVRPHPAKGIDRSGRTLCAPTISRVIKQLKEFVTKQVGYSIWQRSFYDHVIRDDADYAVKYNYILDNPRRWAEDEYYSNR